MKLRSKWGIRAKAWSGGIGQSFRSKPGLPRTLIGLEVGRRRLTHMPMPASVPPQSAFEWLNCQRRSKKGPDGGVKLDHSVFEACPRSPREGPARAAACPSHTADAAASGPSSTPADTTTSPRFKPSATPWIDPPSSSPHRPAKVSNYNISFHGELYLHYARTTCATIGPAKICINLAAGRSCRRTARCRNGG